MMPEARRRGAAEQARETNLPTRGCKQIFTADHVGDFLQVIVDGRDELIRPVAEAIAHEQIAALPARVLFLWAEEFVEEFLDARIDSHAPTDIVGERDFFLATRVRIKLALNFAAGA